MCHRVVAFGCAIQLGFKTVVQCNHKSFGQGGWLPLARRIVSVKTQMASVMLARLNSFEFPSLSQKMCCSLASNFGSDLNNFACDIKNSHDETRMENQESVENYKNYEKTFVVSNAEYGISPKSKKFRKKENLDQNSNAKAEENLKQNESDKEKKKKKKWKSVPIENLGFNFSLFPRPVRDNYTISENEKKLTHFIEEEVEKIEIMSEPFQKLQDFEGCYSGNIKYLRADRDRKIRKVHKEIKDKYCKNVTNNKGRKNLYIHHRLSKLITLDVQTLSYLPSRHKRKGTTVENSAKVTGKPNYTSARVAPVAKPQCLAYALDNNNLPCDFDSQVARLLVSLQHRDVTPEDYDLLLRLDERVKPKTVDENVLSNFRTDKVENNDECEVCPICMEVYMVGQTRKFLPCNHVFHADCIDMWLKNSSMNCPIDNLPLEPS